MLLLRHILTHMYTPASPPTHTHTLRYIQSDKNEHTHLYSSIRTLIIGILIPTLRHRQQTYHATKLITIILTARIILIIQIHIMIHPFNISYSLIYYLHYRSSSWQSAHRTQWLPWTCFPAWKAHVQHSVSTHQTRCRTLLTCGRSSLPVSSSQDPNRSLLVPWAQECIWEWGILAIFFVRLWYVFVCRK